MKCSEPCDRAGCDIVCDKTLLCGHRCIGLCGERCPALCKICDGDDFEPLSRMRLDECDDSECFIQLQDCNHVFSVEMLDAYMQSCFPVSLPLTHSSTQQGDTAAGGGEGVIGEGKDKFVKKSGVSRLQNSSTSLSDTICEQCQDMYASPGRCERDDVRAWQSYQDS